jgi:hypothetical protein
MIGAMMLLLQCVATSNANRGIADCFNIATAVAAEVLLQLLLLRGGPAGLTWPLQHLLERRSVLQCPLEQRSALQLVVARFCISNRCCDIAK